MRTSAIIYTDGSCHTQQRVGAWVAILLIGLTARQTRLLAMEFTTHKGKELPNADLVKELLDYFRLFTIEFIKIKAYQKKTENPNYNIEADHLARKLVRAAIISNPAVIP